MYTHMCENEKKKKKNEEYERHTRRQKHATATVGPAPLKACVLSLEFVLGNGIYHSCFCSAVRCFVFREITDKHSLELVRWYLKWCVGVVLWVRNLTYTLSVGTCGSNRPSQILMGVAAAVWRVCVVREQ